MGWTAWIDENGKEVGIVGDEGWDCTGEFLEKLHGIYYKRFGRVASYEEVIASIDFCYDVIVEEIKEIKR